jgi:hypothetical protein
LFGLSLLIKLLIKSALRRPTSSLFFVPGVMWGEILVTTLSEVSDMGDENLKGCAERVLEITYNPIVFTKTTPDNMK